MKITGPGIEDRLETISKKLAEIAIQSFEKEMESVPPQTMDKTVQLISRHSLSSKPPGEIVLCPSKIDGVEFLKKYNAWGFVNMNRQVPYFALYVGDPESSVLYFGEVDSITKPITSKEDIQRIEEKTLKTFHQASERYTLNKGH